MKKMAILFLTITFLASCGLERKLTHKKEQEVGGQFVPISKVSSQDLKEINESPRHKKLNFMIMASHENYHQVKEQIKSHGGTIKKEHPKIGLIEFEAKGNSVGKLYRNIESTIEVLTIDREVKLNGHFPTAKMDNEAHETDIFPANVMKATNLRDEFYQKYGIELNGENATIAVFDTGLDLGRTDAFQGRIVYLKTLRKEDFATLTDAKEEIIEGKQFLTAEINGTKVVMERTEKLIPERDYYLGFFTEKQFKGRAHYKNYDLNQDGKDEAIFPIIAFKNDHGLFEVYINTSYKGNYPKIGDYSIENEIPLFDFNLVSDSLPEKRYAQATEEILSFYHHTTRLDSVKNNQELDRHKGLINVGITIAPGEELTDDGEEFAVVQITEEGQKLYKIGIVGLDFMGHGTHVAGIAAGQYQNEVDAFSSVANKAKIASVTYLGGTASHRSFINTILDLIDRYPNIIFNFSFGGNTLFNESQDQYSLILDKIAETYHVPFIKSAGNEGPGFNSHGVTCSERMISVSNFFASNSRKAFGNANYPDNKYFLSTSSSRGPMIDGTHKPDIGAPGWVLSSLPLGKPIGEDNERNFDYWSGTSMASPNLAQVIALLYDGIEKAGIRKGEPKRPAIPLDKLAMAIKNGALPYDAYPYADCLGKGEEKGPCQLVKKIKETKWWEGGAGRVNALRSFEILTHNNLVNSPSSFYSTKTTSYIDGFNKEANGFLSIDRPMNKIVFDLELSAGSGLQNLVRMESLNLVIPDDVDWLYFDPQHTQKEYKVSVFNKNKRKILLYVDLKKLMENGRIRPGVHQAVVKGYNVKNPEFFEMTFPVTFVGYHSKFDSDTLGDNHKLATRGFLPAGQFVSYFIPVENEGEAVLIDLDVNDPWPGEMVMYVYHNGLDLPKESMLSKFNIASARTQVYGHGRGHLTYVLHGVPKGLYEIALISGRVSSYAHDDFDLLGSHYKLNAEKMSLDVDSITKTESEKEMTVSLNDMHNPGTLLNIASAKVSILKVKKEEEIILKEKEERDFEINVPTDIKKLHIETQYLGPKSGTDIDIQLLDENGEEVASSMTASSEESIDFEVKQPGKYTLKVIGYAIPNESDSFKVTIEQWLSNPETFANEFKGPTKDLTLKEGFEWKQGRTYSFKTSFPKPHMPDVAGFKGYNPALSVSIEAFYGHDQKKITLLSKDI